MRTFDAIAARRSTFAGLMLCVLATACTGADSSQAEAQTTPQPLAVTPEVRALAPKVEGELAPHVVTQVVESNLVALEDCYAKALGRNPRAAGRVVVHFIIDSEGKVARASVAGSQVQDKLVGRCFTRVIAKLEFAEPEDLGSVDVMHPFALAPRIVGAAPAESTNKS